MNTSINLDLFTAKDPARSKYGQPFVVGNYIYATDGLVIVRVPNLMNLPQSPVAPPNCEAIFERAHYGVKFWIDLPQPDYEAACKTCFGSGKDGGGECVDCGGTGQIVYAVTACGQIGSKVYPQIKTLPSLMLGVKFLPNFVDAIPFRFDGGAGACMPVVSTEKIEQMICKRHKELT